MTQIDFYNFARLHDNRFRRQVLSRLEEILQQNNFIEGKYNLSCEERLARMQRAKHCLLTGNGTDALEIALKVLGIGPQDKVAIPAYTFHASAEAVVNIGATPVLVDVTEYGLISPDALVKVVEQETIKAVMPVHLYGMSADIETIEKICANKGIVIVEDAAQALGGYYDPKKERPIGSGVNLTTCSFYPTKNLSAMGDAGCIFTSDDALAEKIKSLRNHGRGANPFEMCGRNSRCDHWQAAILDLKLSNIEALNEKRRNFAKEYHEKLIPLPLKIVPEAYLETSSWHLYPIFLRDKNEREKLQNFLQKNSIASADFYPYSLEQFSWLKAGDTPTANKLAGTVLCLPMHPYLNKDDTNIIGEALAQFFTN